MISSQYSSSTKYIRCFDLGGNGLKTALLSYESNTNKMNIVRQEVLLGRCPVDKKVAAWVREQMRAVANADLDSEVKSGCSFGFSLAGLDKLCSKPLETDNVSKLFNLPSDRLSSLEDGSAHLLASLKHLKNDLPAGRVWNFAIGTGVGFGFTNSKKEMRSAEELKKFFGGQEAWNVKEPITQKAIWQAGSSKEGFDKIVKDTTKKVDHVAFEIFAARWKAFIEKEIIERSKHYEDQWGMPSAVVFTGGHLDHYGNSLVHELNKKGLKVKALQGPRHAGLLGAAWNVLENQKI